MTTIKKYINDCVRELGNVTWPTKKQAVRITTIVFIFMIISAAVLGAVDYILTVGYQQLLTLAK
jgi:preprotein translocase SecE subunit